MRSRAVDLLRHRIGELDGDPTPVAPFEADPRLLHGILIMSGYTNTTWAGEPSGSTVLLPAEADRLAGACRLLADIAQDEIDLVDGPVQRARQQWIGNSSHAPPATAVPTPDRRRLVEVSDPSPASTKPFGVGMYTSTAATGGRSMWRTYLDSVRGSGLHPLPWYTWDVHVSSEATVAEITSAREWVDLIETHPRRSAGLTYPDWQAIANHVDGVHLTLRAIIAIQGFSFPVSGGVTAASYWDVESTLWLRWCVASERLREVTDEE